MWPAVPINSTPPTQTVTAHLLGIHSAIKMLNARVGLIKQLLHKIQSGEGTRVSNLTPIQCSYYHTDCNAHTCNTQIISIHRSVVLFLPRGFQASCPSIMVWFARYRVWCIAFQSWTYPSSTRNIYRWALFVLSLWMSSLFPLAVVVIMIVEFLKDSCLDNHRAGLQRHVAYHLPGEHDQGCQCYEWDRGQVCTGLWEDWGVLKKATNDMTGFCCNQELAIFA